MKRKSKRLIVWMGIILIILVVVLILLILQDSKSSDSLDNEKPNEEMALQEEIPQTESNILYQSEEIEIYTIFPSSVINVDADSTFVDNLASVEFKNISGRFLKTCEIHMESADGDKFSFLAKDIPAEMEIMAFDVSNKTIDENVEIVNIICNAEEDAEEAVPEDVIETSVNGMEVTVHNIGKEDLSNVSIICHCMMDNMSYGGTTFEYPVEKMKAGEKVVIEAVDCYFGQPEVVRVTID